ncbi:MAG: hypothetical protein ACO2ER_04380 [Castellaniella sp.]
MIDQRQLGLCQTELLADGAQGVAELSGRPNGCHGLLNFPFGKLPATTGLCASDIYRSGNKSTRNGNWLSLDQIGWN